MRSFIIIIITIILKVSFIIKARQEPRWGTSLVVQWLGIRLPMQGTGVRSLVGGTKIPHAVVQVSPGAATGKKTACCNEEPACHN